MVSRHISAMLNRLPVQLKATAAVLIPSVAIVVAVFLFARAEERLAEARTSVLRTAEVQREAQSLVAHVARAAAAVRGFALVADERFVNTYSAERRAAERSVKTLSEL